MATRKKILWLVSWYPNKYDCFDGDFIQRHARAAALYDDIHVIFIKQHEEQNEVEKKWHGSGGLTEQIIYLPKQKGFFGKLKNFCQWQRFYKAAASDFIGKHQPAFVHVHVPWKAGLIALWVQKKYKIHYIITEHWGIYNTVADDNIYTKSFPVKFLLKKIYSQAKSFISVSRFLAEGVNKALIKKEYLVLPNAVDTDLFYPVDSKYSKFTFLHVSNMVPLKNVEGIIHAFHQFVTATGAGAQLILIGNRDNHYYQLAESLGLLNRCIFFRGEIPYTDVAKEMQHSHVFVLNSNIENSPCVIGEALCCGLPVIATNVGGIPELVTKENSLLIPSKNSTELSAAMVKLYSSYHQFNSSQNAIVAKHKFSFASVGHRLHNLYQESK